MTDPVKVVIADDHAPTRAGVAAALERGGFIIAAAVGSGEAAVAAALEHRPAACVLDVEMPGAGGIAAAREIHDALPEVGIMMLTANGDEDRLFEALRAGAVGFLLKDTDPDRLAAALRGIMAGEAAIPRSLVARLVHEFTESERRRPAILQRRGIELSDRESEVLERLRDERSTKQIADELGLSRVTVRRHISRLLTKLDVPDREAAVLLLQDATPPPAKA